MNTGSKSILLQKKDGESIMQIAFFTIVVIMSIIHCAIQAQSLLPQNAVNHNTTFICLIIVLLIGSVSLSMLNSYLSNCFEQILSGYCSVTDKTVTTQYVDKLDIVASCDISYNEALNIMNVNVTARTTFPISEMYIAWSDQNGESRASAMFKRGEKMWEYLLSTRIDSELTGFIIACTEDGQISVTTFDVPDK